MKLTEAQRRAILTDERAIEALDFRERDELIVNGYARRAWPSETGDERWRTWLTVKGVRLRNELASGVYDHLAGRRALQGSR